MEDRFCPSCGAARDPEHTFCPKCGRNFVPKVKPDALHHPVYGRLIALIVGAFVLWMIYTLNSSPVMHPAFAAMVAPSTPTATPAMPCAQAEQLVYQRHATMYALMRSAVDSFQIVCGLAQNSQRPIGVMWEWRGALHQGTYSVDLSGRVIPIDATAQRLDEAAKLGPLAMTALAKL